MSNSSVWIIDRTLSDATTPGQSGPGSNSNQGVEMAAGERDREIKRRTSIIDTTLDTYSRVSWGKLGFTSYLLKSRRDTHIFASLIYLFADCSPNLPESLCDLRISCQYIIFLTPTHFPSGSKFTGFISAVLLFSQVNILFRNPQQTCCQRSICHDLTIICCTVDRFWNKQSARVKLII